MAAAKNRTWKTGPWKRLVETNIGFAAPADGYRRLIVFCQ